MPELLNTCPVCNSHETEFYIQCKDFTVSNEQFNLVRCKACSFVFTNPRPDENEIGSYYKATSYVSHTDTREGLINKLYHTVRKFTLGKKLTLINKLNNTSSRKLLDVGCGTGYFIEYCQNNNWKVSGVEVDKNAREAAEKRINGPSTSSGQALSKGEGKKIHDSLSEVVESTFDIITLWHVLEHVHQLDNYITTLKQLLSSSGKLVIAVPNIDSYDCKHYNEYWAAYDVPRHLYHFNPQSMGTILKKYNLKIEQILPMKFDSFYVSMLSEKYKYGKINYLRTFINGLKSNLVAAANNQYSSLIYVISNI